MHIILIDGKNALFRFGCVHPNLKTSDGIRTGAAFGLVGCLLRLKKKYPESRFVMIWDGPGKSWRHELFPQYKGNRPKEKPKMVQDILSQTDTVEKLLNALGVIQITVPHVEADDVIGILAVRCLKRQWQPVIYSSDKDFMQLMCRGVQVIRDVVKPSKLAPETARTVLAKFGCTPEQLLDVRALAGDKSDNIPNVYRGMGPKTATQIVASGDYGGEKMCPAVMATFRRNRRLMRILTTTKTKVLPLLTRRFLKASTTCVLSELAATLGPGKVVKRRAVINALAGLELAEAMASVSVLSRLQR